MTDAISKILSGETTISPMVVQPGYLIEICDRFIRAVEDGVKFLPERPAKPDREDEQDLMTAASEEAEYQAAFQELGESLLPAMKAIVAILLASPKTISLGLLQRMAASRGVMTYWGFMTQHTDINKLEGLL